MKTATVRTLRNDYAKLLRRVETGEEISISRRGRIVARLVPANAAVKDSPVNWADSETFKILKGGKPRPAAETLKHIHDAQGNW